MLEKDWVNLIPMIALRRPKQVLYVTGSWRIQGQWRRTEEGIMVGQEDGMRKKKW